MKIEIMELINSESASLKINKFLCLERWKKDAIGNKVDKLEAIFSIQCVRSRHFEIKSRDYNGILAEVQECQTKAFSEAAEEYNKQLRNGYIG